MNNIIDLDDHKPDVTIMRNSNGDFTGISHSEHNFYMVEFEGIVYIGNDDFVFEIPKDRFDSMALQYLLLNNPELVDCCAQEKPPL